MEHVAGADLHKRVTQLALLRDGQPPSQARFANDRASVERALTRLPAGTTIAVESTGSWWWFVDTARPLGHRIVHSHPKLTKAIAAARLKSDTGDAVMLGQAAEGGSAPHGLDPGRTRAAHGPTSSERGERRGSRGIVAPLRTRQSHFV